MKNMTFPNVAKLAIASALLIGSIITICLFAGCTNGNPTVAADKTAVTAAQTQLAADKATAATQPTTQATATVTADQTAVVNAMNKLSADTTAAMEAQTKSITAVLATTAASVPSPWGAPAAALITVIGMGVTSYLGKGSVQAVAGNAASATASASANHAASIQSAIVQLANSVPISSLPAGLQSVAKAGVAAANELNAAAPKA